MPELGLNNTYHYLNIDNDVMNAVDFHNKMAIGFFKPIYPVIAKYMLQKSPRKKGVCVDVGGGSGVLCVEIARISQFNLLNIEPNSDFIDIAKDYVSQTKFFSRIINIKGSAEQIPVESDSADLVVSRGSIYFWQDKIAGIKEVYRVLKPGAVAIIGGGMGSTKLAREISKQLKEDKKWHNGKNLRYRSNLPIHHKIWMQQSGIKTWEIESSQEGTWIIITK